MRIYLINVKGHGLDLSINKLTEEQYQSPDNIKSDSPIFELYGVKAEDLEIEIIDDNGKVFETFIYDDLNMCEVDHLPQMDGHYQLTESFEKGLFYQFELFLAEYDKFNVDHVTMETKEYEGEEYICNILYDGDPLESIKSSTDIIERKIRKIIK